MTPPLRERLGWRTSLEVDGSALGNSAAMARAAFWLGASAALISLLAIVLPHSPDLDEAGLAAVAVAAAALAAGALIGFDSLPRWAFHVGTAVGSVTATAAIYFWGETSFYGPLPLLWPAFFAFLFFPVREALVHVALMGALFAGELVLQDPDYTPVADWVATVGSLVGTGLLLTIIRARLAGRISDLAVAALRDPLTGLLNRRGFEHSFDVELERARRTDQSLSVIVGDLDDFERVNDPPRRRRRATRSCTRSACCSSPASAAGTLAARVGDEEFVAADAGHRRARRVHPGRAGAHRDRAGLRGPRAPCRSRSASAS